MFIVGYFPRAQCVAQLAKPAARIVLPAQRWPPHRRPPRKPKADKISCAIDPLVVSQRFEEAFTSAAIQYEHDAYLRVAALDAPRRHAESRNSLLGS
jgi:hypothetical protein